MRYSFFLEKSILSFPRSWVTFFRATRVAMPLLVAVIALASSKYAESQVAPSAYTDRRALWVGGEYSDFEPDWGPNRMGAIGVYADWTIAHRVAAEGEVRFLHWNSFEGENENTFLLGPKVRLWDWRGLHPYGKILFGVGNIDYPNDFGTGNYFVFAPAGGVDYSIAHGWSVRGEYEYQFWPSAPGIPGLPDNGITPHGISFGVAFRIVNR